jgi:hypothetical protein
MRIRKNIISTVLLTALLLPIWASRLNALSQATLQQGVSGYNGCEDTYVNWENLYQVNGSSPIIRVTEGGC